MTVTISRLKEEWADREAIRDCLYRYARGIDRIDEDMLRSAYWPDATDDHAGMFTGPASDFVDWAMTTLPGMERTMHVVANVLIRIDGDSAAVESYVYAIHRMDVENEKRDVIGAGRYLDRFARRGDEWRIAERVVTVDWIKEYPDSVDWEKSLFETKEADRGARKPADRSYGWLGLA